MKPVLSRGIAVALALAATLSMAACKNSDDAGGSKPSHKPSSSQSSHSSSSSPSPTGVPQTTVGAISRYEDYLHAVGNKDTDTLCEIAKPAMDTVGGDCASNFKMMFQLISAEQLDALKTATIIPSKVEERAADKVYIPTAAIKADVQFQEDELGPVTLRYQNDNWYIVDES